MVPASSPGAASFPRVILFTRSLSQPAIIDPIHRALGGAREIDARVVSSGAELREAIEGNERVVLFANCLMKEDIADLYNTLPGFENRVSEGTLRIFVLNSIRHPGLGSLLRSRAVLEIVELPVTMKAIQYKLKQSLTYVHQSHLRKHAAAQAKSADSVRDGEGKLRPSGAKKKASNLEVRWQSAIDFDSDFWWIGNRKNIRNVVGVWLIDLLGPGPVTGTWEELPGIERHGEKAWAWRPRPIAEDVFQTPNGRWVFFGKQPEFSWQKNLWAFVSKYPMLAFYAEQATVPEYVRIEFRPDEGLLFLENSGHTKALLERIQATLESRLGFGGGTENVETEETAGGFEGWDFAAEESGSVQTTHSESGEEGGPEWNDHTGAQGFAFDPTRHRTGGAPAPKPWRNALSADPEIGARTGLADIDTPGVRSGSETFAKISLSAEVLRCGGERVDPAEKLLVYEVTEAGAALLVPARWAKLGQRFDLRILLDAGGTKLDCAMEWELGSVDLSLEDNRLATGNFRSGDFDTLFRLLDRLEARKKELKQFYEKARG